MSWLNFRTIRRERRRGALAPWTLSFAATARWKFLVTFFLSRRSFATLATPFALPARWMFFVLPRRIDSLVFFWTGRLLGRASTSVKHSNMKIVRHVKLMMWTKAWNWNSIRWQKSKNTNSNYSKFSRTGGGDSRRQGWRRFCCLRWHRCFRIRIQT